MLMKTPHTHDTSRPAADRVPTSPRFGPFARLVLVLPLGLLLGSARAQTAAEEAGPETGRFRQAASTVHTQLEQSLAELSDLRERIADEKIPMSKKLNDLEAQLSDVRREFRETSWLLDNRTLDLSNLNSEIESREKERTYLSNLLSEYIRTFETRLHIAEKQRYEDPLEAARLAPENSNLSQEEVYARQTGLVEVSITRLEDALGGTRFDGTAVDTTGLVKQGAFAMVGPTALFASKDGSRVGTAEQRLGSVEPAIIPFENEEDAQAAEQVVKSGEGVFPLDPTLGKAHKVESTKETLVEHVSKGGVVMVPILGLAGLALLVALFKWIGLTFTRSPSQKRITRLLAHVGEKNRNAAMEEANRIGGPAGKMLQLGLRHLDESREIIEEIMYEKVLQTRLKLQRLLPFVAICAASAPLLGLLGTVTGIINTFKMITVFGSGDVKTLSGGISEALITTEFGLIVAIPSLLLHAYLSRKARGIVDSMEKAAVALVNQVAKTWGNEPHDDDPGTMELNPQSGDEKIKEGTVTEALTEVSASG